MSTETLKKKLAALHEELTQDPTLDEQSRQLLRQIMGDIEKLGSSSDSTPAASRQNRLKALAVEFEVEHPTLADSLRQVIDLLATAGL